MPARRLLRGAWLLLALGSVLVSACSVESPTRLDALPEGPGEIVSTLGAPAGYYDTIDASTAAALRTTLHAVIDDHTRFPYTSTATDTWDVLETADQDPGNPNNILDLYGNNSFPKAGGGNTLYNREHSWPKSYGFPNDSSSNYPYTDCHHLFLCDDGYNSARSNRPYRNCDSGCTEYPTVVNAGMGGGSGTYPGNSNWGSGSFDAGTWQVWSSRKGDVARALFYMDVRYEGGTHGVTGVSEPDLVLTDDQALISASNTGANLAVAYMGILSVLIQWHLEDPVDDLERARNDAVYSFQGNRNPFVDNPQWVECLFLGSCAPGGDTTPPAAPTGLVATAGDGSVSLDWADNGESDLAGYNVYRATSSGGPYSPVNGSLLATSDHLDGGLTNGTTYWYLVTAVDTSANESADSAVVSATPAGGGGGGGAVVWINEFHYDNDGTDTGEFVEVAGPAGTDLTGWTLLGYNGNGGTVYATVNLGGTLVNQQGGFGTAAFDFVGLQNGSPDGIALVDAGGTVVQFLSYEGILVATDGPAAGTSSTDVVVSEASTSPVGFSLQLAGTGSTSADFVWQAPAAHTRGAPNNGQTLGDGSPGGGGTTWVHVASIVPSAVRSGKSEKARAVVTVVDAGGAPVAGASVTVSFTGSVNETLSGTTGADGSVTLTTNAKGKRPIAFTVCVDGVSGEGLGYDSAADVESCDTHGGA